MFFNFSLLNVRHQQDILDIENAVRGICQPLPQKIKLVVNYDHSRIDEHLMDEYAAMVERLTAEFYSGRFSLYHKCIYADEVRPSTGAKTSSTTYF